MRTRLPLAGLAVAAGLSSFGLAMTLIAIPWYVLHSTGSGTQTGAVTAAETLGLLLSIVLAGPLVDRAGPRRLSITADAITAAAIALIPLAELTVGLPVPLLAVLAFTAGATRAPSDTAKQVLLAQVAEPAGIRLERASSAVDAAMRLGRMVGAPVAGGLVAVLGPVPVLVVDTATLLASAGLVAVFVRGRTPARDGDDAGDRADSYLRRLLGGVRYLRGDRLLRAALPMLMVTNALDVGLSGVLYPAYGSQVFDSSALVGLMVTALGIGGLGGAALYGWIGHRLSRWAVFTACFLLLGMPRFVLLALEPPAPVLLPLLAVSGLGSGALNPILLAVVHERVPAMLRGRVLSLASGGAIAAMPLGTMLAGVLLDWTGLTGALVTFAVIYLVATTFPLIFPVWRELDHRPATPEHAPVAV
ncbi:MFS transporter [Amycolatopsis antarctica]|uniref:MFS transporter n=1 Tax=Amycolatopsis antarctica TaxID=1854586 RepID=A0A263D389_9PSEU|nr:MFS transporter [Amycolatopsis antarctica]OZM72944.1 MFS transporter [Amycolatopsis antarctica]